MTEQTSNSNPLTCQMCTRTMNPTDRKKVEYCFYRKLTSLSSTPGAMKKFYLGAHRALKLYLDLDKQTPQSVLQICLSLDDVNVDVEMDKDESDVCLSDLLDQCSNFPLCWECFGPLMKFGKMMETPNEESQLLQTLKDLKLKIVTDLESKVVVTKEKTDDGLPHFPDEIWEIILNQLTTLDDMRTAVNSFQVWRKILKPKQNLWFFPTVILPFISEYLTKKELLLNRLVCSHWCQGIDEFLESAQHLAPFTSQRPSRSLHLKRYARFWNPWSNELPPTSITAPYVLDNSRQRYWFGMGRRHQQEDLVIVNIEGFQRVMTSNGFFYAMRDSARDLQNRSVFIGRSLFIRRMHLSTIPEEFRRHIWHLDFSYWDQKNVSCLDLLGNICLALKTMPNLRQLKINVGDIYECETYKALMKHGEMQLPGISPLVMTIPPKIKTLQLELNSKACEEMLHLLLKRLSANLGRLEIESWSIPKRWSHFDWSNLTELHIIGKKYSSYIPGKLLYGLAPLAQTAPKLGKLGLTFYSNVQDPDIEFPRRLLRILAGFKRLQWLKLNYINEGPQPTSIALDEEEFLDIKWRQREFCNNFNNIPNIEPASFPEVKVLEINLRPITEGFLLHFPNLEELILSPVPRLNTAYVSLLNQQGFQDELENFKIRDPIVMDSWINGKGDISGTPSTLFDYKMIQMLTKRKLFNPSSTKEEMDAEMIQSGIWQKLKKLKSITVNDYEFRKGISKGKEISQNLIQMQQSQHPSFRFRPPAPLLLTLD